MRLPHWLALVSCIVAAGVLITLAAMTSAPPVVDVAGFARFAKATDPGGCIDALRDDALHWERRSAIYRGLCYILIVIVVANVYVLALWPRRSPQE